MKGRVINRSAVPHSERHCVHLFQRTSVHDTVDRVELLAERHLSLITNHHNSTSVTGGDGSPGRGGGQSDGICVLCTCAQLDNSTRACA